MVQHAVYPGNPGFSRDGVQPQRYGEGVRDDDPLTVAQLRKLGVEQLEPVVHRRPVGVGRLRVEHLLALSAQGLGQLPLPMLPLPSGPSRKPIGYWDGLDAAHPRPMTSGQLRSRRARCRAQRRTDIKGDEGSMVTFTTIGYVDRAGYAATAGAVHDA